MNCLEEFAELLAQKFYNKFIHVLQKKSELVKEILNIARDRVKLLCNMVLHKFTPEILDEFLRKIKKEVNDE